MFTPARTAVHDVLCFGRRYRGSYRSIAISATNVDNALAAQRFFSECRSLQRRKRIRIRGPEKKLTDSTLTDSTFHARSQGEIEFRNPMDHNLFQEFVCERLKDLALIDEQSEAAKLALEVQKAPSIPYGSKAQGWTKEVQSLHDAFFERGKEGLDLQIRHTLSGLVANRDLSPAMLQCQSDVADLRYPLEWYPGTRTIQRTIHLHVGPTNSGKTYQALRRLEQAESGVYAGPLRLLAHEVYTRLNAKGKPCHLVTGDDKRFNEDDCAMVSCTVEMVPTNKVVEVGVIDEIQMIGDVDRGWAWTQALLGLRAKELHLCGEARTVPLIRELAAQMEEKLVLHHYERLSPLQVDTQSLKGDLKQLRKGDCLVVFSRQEIHAFKSQIERVTKRRVAIVYGNLPPETRASQARLFNDPDNEYDFLVASDAIGMGLNLDIKRIIFESTYKFNGRKYCPIPIPHLKQVAGRAGRYRIAPQSKIPSQPYENLSDGLPDDSSKPSTAVIGGSTGLVTSLEQMDYARMCRAMQTEPEPVMTAGILPPTDVLMRFAAYYPPGTPFSYILLRLNEIALVHPRYHICDLKEQVSIADKIETVKDLTLHDRLVFCASPANFKYPEFNPILVDFAKCVAKNTTGALLDIPSLHLEILDMEVSMDRVYLKKLELLHKALILYIWLSYRFVGVFKDQNMAFHVKGIVEEKINQVLAHVSYTRRKLKLKKLRLLAKLEGSDKAFRHEGEGHKMEPTQKDEQPVRFPEQQLSLKEIFPEDYRQEAVASQA